MEKDTIGYLNSLNKGEFCTINIPLINNETIPITVMYMGKDREGRYRFVDRGNFVLPPRLIEQKAIKVDREYDESIAIKIKQKFKMLQQIKKKRDRDR